MFWEVLFAEPFQVLPQVDQRAVFFSIYLNAALIVALGIVRSSEIRPAPLSRLGLCAIDPPHWPSWLLLLLPVCGWAQKTHTHLPAAKIFIASLQSKPKYHVVVTLKRALVRDSDRA